MKEKVFVIIPTYNERNKVVSLIEQLQKVFQEINDYDMNILIFDRHSNDDTFEIIKGMKQKYANLYLFSMFHKTRLGMAYMQSLYYAMDKLDADILIEFHPDAQQQVKYIPTMLEQLKTNVDVVLGSRYVKGGGVNENWSWKKRLAVKIANLTGRIFLTHKYRDFTTDFRCFRRRVIKKIDLHDLPLTYDSYKLYLLWNLHKISAKIVEFPISFSQDKPSQNQPDQGINLENNKMIETILAILFLRIKEMQRYFKLLTAGLLGVVVQFLSFNFFRLFLNSAVANFLAVEIVILMIFIFNHKITFKDRAFAKNPSKIKWVKKFLQFNILSSGSLCLQTLLLLLSLHLYGANFYLENIFVGFGVLLGSIINYFFYTRVIWKHARNDFLA